MLRRGDYTCIDVCRVGKSSVPPKNIGKSIDRDRPAEQHAASGDECHRQTESPKQDFDIEIRDHARNLRVVHFDHDAEVGIGQRDSGSAAFDANGNVIAVASWGYLSGGGEIGRSAGFGYACVACSNTNRACDANAQWVGVRSTVPKPSTYVMMFAGLIGISVYSRRDGATHRGATISSHLHITFSPSAATLERSPSVRMTHRPSGVEQPERFGRDTLNACMNGPVASGICPVIRATRGHLSVVLQGYQS